jgi:hypothetical protein
MLDHLADLAARFESGGAPLGAELRARGLELIEVFAAHLRLEDAELAPALRALGSHGSRQANRLEHEHREQRALLEFLLSRLEQDRNPSLVVARELRNFVEYVRLDMSHEEDTLLREDILAD